MNEQFQFLKRFCVADQLMRVIRCPLLLTLPQFAADGPFRLPPEHRLKARIPSVKPRSGPAHQHIRGPRFLALMFPVVAVLPAIGVDAVHLPATKAQPLHADERYIGFLGQVGGGDFAVCHQVLWGGELDLDDRPAPSRI